MAIKSTDKRRGQGRNGRLSRAQAYNALLFSPVYDLKGMVELFGLEKVISLATAIDDDMRKGARSTNKSGRKIGSARNGQRSLSQCVSESVDRAMQRLDARKTDTSRRVKVAA